MLARWLLRSAWRGVVLVSFFWNPSASSASDLEAECRAAQVRDIGTYGRCRLEAARAARDVGRAPDYASCETSFARSWAAQLPEGGCEQYAAENTVSRSVRSASTAP